MYEAIDNLNVSHLPKDISVPALILHSEGDLVVPFIKTQFMAARVREARFVTLISTNYLMINYEYA